MTEDVGDMSRGYPVLRNGKLEWYLILFSISGNLLNSGALKPSFNELLPPLINCPPLCELLDRRFARGTSSVILFLNLDAAEDDVDDDDDDDDDDDAAADDRGGVDAADDEDNIDDELG